MIRPSRRKARLKAALIGQPRLYEAARRFQLVLRYLARRPHEPDFAYLGTVGRRDGLFLDIGGNAGQSALSFRLFNRSAPILSIEPNPACERDLRLAGRLAGNFRYLILAAGDSDGTLTLHVPTYRGRPLTGEASLVPLGPDDLHSLQGRPSAVRETEIVRQTVEVRRLDELELEPAFVKIDVEGFEPNVVRGLSATIRRCRPLILLEANTRFAEVLDLLSPLGYRARRFDPATRRLCDYRGDAQNVFLVPPAAARERKGG